MLSIHIKKKKRGIYVHKRDYLKIYIFSSADFSDFVTLMAAVSTLVWRWTSLFPANSSRKYISRLITRNQGCSTAGGQIHRRRLQIRPLSAAHATGAQHGDSTFIHELQVTLPFAWSGGGFLTGSIGGRDSRRCRLSVITTRRQWGRAAAASRAVRLDDDE